MLRERTRAGVQDASCYAHHRRAREERASSGKRGAAGDTADADAHELIGRPALPELFHLGFSRFWR